MFNVRRSLGVIPPEAGDFLARLDSTVPGSASNFESTPHTHEIGLFPKVHISDGPRCRQATRRRRRRPTGHPARGQKAPICQRLAAIRDHCRQFGPRIAFASNHPGVPHVRFDQDDMGPGSTGMRRVLSRVLEPHSIPAGAVRQIAPLGRASAFLPAPTLSSGDQLRFLFFFAGGTSPARASSPAGPDRKPKAENSARTSAIMRGEVGRRPRGPLQCPKSERNRPVGGRPAAAFATCPCACENRKDKGKQRCWILRRQTA
jgi:hypothetical protein